MIMEKMKKVTKKDIFTEIKGIFEEMKRQDLVEFCNHELIQLDKKANAKKGTTKTQKENEKIMDLIEEMLNQESEPVTITDLINRHSELSEYVTEAGNPLTNQKISALLTLLIKANRVIRTEEKRKAFFSTVK